MIINQEDVATKTNPSSGGEIIFGSGVWIGFDPIFDSGAEFSHWIPKLVFILHKNKKIMKGWRFVCFIILNKNLVFVNFSNFFNKFLFEIYVRFAKIKCSEFADEQKHNCRLAPPPSHLYLFPFTCTFSSKSVWEIFSINIHPNSNLLLIFSHL